MRRVFIIFVALLSSVAGCKDEPKESTPPVAEAPQWTAEVAELESITNANVEVRPSEGSDFTPWRGGQPIPPGAAIQTGNSLRATILLPDGGRLTLNHSTRAVLEARDRLVLETGQAVVEYPADGKHDVTVVLPTGEAVLHGTKVSVVAGQKESVVSVTQGLVEVRHDNESFEGRAGQEIVLRDGQSPFVTESSDLGRRFGWSEIGETNAVEKLPEVPRGLGKLVGKTPGGETEHRLDLEKHQVSVKVQGNIAYTEITEVFANPTGQTLEGVYRFPLPADARISRLALKVGDKIMEGEFLETARAERIWRDVIHKWRDPAMLKWKEGNTFELRIFPIEPRQKRQVTIGYVQRLEPSVGGYRYTYPMPVDHAGLIPADRFEFDATLFGHDATQPLEVTGYPAQLETGATQADQAVARVRFSEDDFVARGDLGFRFGRGESNGLRTYVYQEKGRDPYAVFALRPELPTRQEIKPRDFVVIVDRSTNRRGAAMHLQQRLVPQIIREMDPLDRVTVIECAERCAPVGEPDFAPARASTADVVGAALGRLEASGATYPVEAVRVAAELFRRRPETSREPHVVYLTDGIASAGELRPGQLAEAVQRTLKPFDARMSIVDVGGDSDRANLDALATAGRGRVTRVDPMLSMTGQALTILADHYRNILEQPTVVLPDGVSIDGVLPTAIASGDELVFAARFDKPVTGELTLTGRLNGEPFSVQYSLVLSPSREAGNSFVPGEWAAHKVAALELDASDHRKEIIRLSKTYGVLSRYTTLLALESKQMMDEYGVRARNRTQWTGNEGAAELVEEEPSADVEATIKPSPSPTRRSTSAPRKSKSPSAPGSGPMLLDDFGGGGGGTARPEPRARRRPHALPYRRRRPAVNLRAAEPTTSWERDNVQRKRDRLGKDRDNRSRRMSLIRAMIRAGQIADATTETELWLATNPMDPEAIVQMAQIHARRGELDDFYRLLIGAADAAPRGRWLQERIHRAATAQGDAALACAFEVALEATAKRPPKAPADILACPMTTHVRTWFGESAPNAIASPPVTKQPNGALKVALTSTGGDWDLALVEPTGRLLWWGSSRQRLKTENVIGTDRTEYLALPSLRRGTYSVMALPRSARPGDRLTVVIEASGRTQKFDVGTDGMAVELAEVVRR